MARPEKVQTYGNQYVIHKRIENERPDYSLLDSVIIVSIDPGKRDLGIHVERRYKCGLIRVLGCYKFNIRYFLHREIGGFHCRRWNCGKGWRHAWWQQSFVLGEKAIVSRETYKVNMLH